MAFEVNGIPYFLTFETSAAQWFLLTPTRTGVESVQIYNDGTLMTAPVVLTPCIGGTSA